jgi:hypothetical protein
MTIGGVRRRCALLLVLLPVLISTLPAIVSAMPADAVGPLALAAALAAGLVIAVAAGTGLRLNPEAAPTWARMLSLRDRAERTPLLRLRDPDARGRTRPRAPTAAPAAA